MGQGDCGELNLLRREIHDRLLRKNDKAAISAFFRRAFPRRLEHLSEGGGQHSWKFLVALGRLVFQILNLFQTKKYYFPHPFSDLASKIHARFQTWPLINYVIVTLID